MSLAAERRAFRRTGADADLGADRLRIRPGWEARVIDASRNGALLETVTRLLPGSTVEALFRGGTGTVVIRARVTRCWVSGLDLALGIRYRAGVAFERPISDDLAML